MKIRNICISLTLVCTAILIPFTSCKKDQVKTDSKSELSSESTNKIFILVDTFLKEKSSNLKTGETLSVDSTIWYLETVLNATYARVETERKVLLTDSAFISIPLEDDGSVSIRSLYLAYDKLLDSLSTFYYSIPGEKSIIVNDVYQVNLTNSQLQIGMNMILAQMPTQTTPINVWFEAGDDWIWGLGGGKCNNTLQGRDAATELTTHANYSIPTAPSGQSYIWINIWNTQLLYPWDVPLPNGQTNPYGYGHYYLFDHGSNMNPEYHACLSFDQMNYYLQNLFDIGLLLQPPAKEPIHYFVDSETDSGIGYWLHIHRARLTYGTRVVIYYPVLDPPRVE